MKKSNKKEVKMTEKKWIAKYHKQGFELYKTSNLKPKLDALWDIKDKLDKLLNVK